MSPRDTADTQLERILYILPAAARPGGASFAELTRALAVPVETVLADIERVASREYYHPAGTVDSLGIYVHGDRVHLHAANGFDRPVRLNVREALALSLGLRVLASEAPVERAAGIVALAERLEAELTVPDVGPAAELSRPPSADLHRDAAPAFTPLEDEDQASYLRPREDVEYDRDEEAEVLLDLGADDARGILADAITLRRVCAIRYVKPGDAAPAERRIEPRLLVYHEGFWYVVAQDSAQAAQRVFRLDRMLGVRMMRETFEPHGDVDARSLFRDGIGPFASEDEHEVAVRYSPRIARWIAERTAAPLEADGSVVVRHRVADARWIVRHVLQYGGDAVLESASPFRRLVADTARRIAS